MKGFWPTRIKTELIYYTKPAFVLLQISMSPKQTVTIMSPDGASLSFAVRDSTLLRSDERL